MKNGAKLNMLKVYGVRIVGCNGTGWAWETDDYTPTVYYYSKGRAIHEAARWLIKKIGG